MPNSVAPPELESTSGGSVSIQHEVIQTALQEIFQSAPFRASRQCQDLLRYIVTHTMTNDDQLLRERVIGMEVFARKPDYDTGDDPVVRLRASELRKRLAQFYQSAAGKPVPVQISIPAGSYRASFTWLNSAPPEPAASEAGVAIHPGSPLQTSLTATAGKLDVPKPGPQSLAPRARRAGLWAAGILLLVCLCGGLSYWKSSRASALDQFWGPLMKDSHPTLICMGSNAVYRLSNDFLADYEKRTGEAHDGIEFIINPIPGEKLDQRDLLRANNSFVALGDVAAASEVVSFLSRRGKLFTERFPTDMSFAEIQEYSSILIGGFNNQMALTITKDLPYVMKGSNRIEERSNPQRNWPLQFYGDARESEDYALISRLVDPSSQHEIVTVGGIGQYGTQAAAAFLTDPDGMKSWAAGLPQGWNRKNLQIVLHVKIIDYRPVAREVVLTKVW